MGSGACQRNVVFPCAVRCPRSTPLATAVRPCGTVIVKSYVDLSLGWLFAGNQDIAPCGSPATKAPSSVAIQPSAEPSGSVTCLGTPL